MKHPGWVAGLAALAAVAACENRPVIKAVEARRVVDVPAGRYDLDKTHASIVWRVNHWGLAYYTSRFARFDATLHFDPARPERSTIHATIDPTSVKTDYPGTIDFDAELAGKGFFEAATYPTITFRSRRVTRTGPNQARVEGDLTMLGRGVPVVLDVTFNGGMRVHPLWNRAAIGFSAKGRIDRSRWGMTHLLDHVSDTVDFQIEAEFVQPAPAGPDAP